MKADILRRAEAISSEEEDEAPKGRIVAYEEELDDDDDGHASLIGTVKVLGDGEESGGDDGDDGDDDGVGVGAGIKENPNTETVLELAYIRDPRLFERDAQTRRGKGRIELRDATGTSLFLFCRYFSKQKIYHMAWGCAI
jgi:activating signal cointegrator complex subunit 2